MVRGVGEEIDPETFEFNGELGEGSKKKNGIDRVLDYMIRDLPHAPLLDVVGIERDSACPSGIQRRWRKPSFWTEHYFPHLEGIEGLEYETYRFHFKFRRHEEFRWPASEVRRIYVRKLEKEIPKIKLRNMYSCTLISFGLTSFLVIDFRIL